MILIAAIALLAPGQLVDAIASRHAYTSCLKQASTDLLNRRTRPDEAARLIGPTCAGGRAAFIKARLAQDGENADPDEANDVANAMVADAVAKYRASFEASKLPGE